MKMADLTSADMRGWQALCQQGTRKEYVSISKVRNCLAPVDKNASILKSV
jgi:hypothetical protein